MAEEHKARASYGVCYHCSCGWQSSVWFGKGAQASAASELRTHKERAARLVATKEEV